MRMIQIHSMPHVFQFVLATPLGTSRRVTLYTSIIIPSFKKRVPGTYHTAVMSEINQVSYIHIVDRRSYIQGGVRLE